MECINWCLHLYSCSLQFISLSGKPLNSIGCEDSCYCLVIRVLVSGQLICPMLPRTLLISFEKLIKIASNNQNWEYSNCKVALIVEVYSEILPWNSSLYTYSWIFFSVLNGLVGDTSQEDNIRNCIKTGFWFFEQGWLEFDHRTWLFQNHTGSKYLSM